jgi:hypothetical protein
MNHNYKIYLAGPAGTVGDEKSLAGTAQKGGQRVDQEAINNQEKGYILYAWPVQAFPARLSSPKSGGPHAFVITEAARIYETDMQAKTYTGADGPSADAALPKGTSLAQYWDSGRLGGTPCNDGNAWTAYSPEEK